MNALGKHIIAEFYDCDRIIINNNELVEDIMMQSVELSGATPIKGSFHKFSPHGVSGFVVISESHFSIHTWPEYGYCAVDIFTCGDLINNEVALKYLKEKFESKNLSVVEMKRGILSVDSIMPHKPIAAT